MHRIKDNVTISSGIMIQFVRKRNGLLIKEHRTFEYRLR